MWMSGRKEEQQILEDCVNSSQPQLLVCECLHDKDIKRRVL